jgi:hypothetical protein
MGKYDAYARKSQKPKNRDIHPIWRGIGFMMMIILPIMSYFGMLLVMQENFKNSWIRIPASVMVPKTSWVFAVIPDSFLYVKIVIFLIILTLLFAILMFFNFVVYALFGPKRYGPLDAPPLERKPRKKY